MKQKNASEQSGSCDSSSPSNGSSANGEQQSRGTVETNVIVNGGVNVRHTKERKAKSSSSSSSSPHGLFDFKHSEAASVDNKTENDDIPFGISDSSGSNVKFESKSDIEATPVVQFGLKLTQMGLSLSSPNLRTATSLFSSSDSDEGSANEGSDKSKNESRATNNNADCHRHHPADEFTLHDGNEETISGENDVEYAEFSMVHQVPAHVVTTITDGINEAAALNEEIMFLRLFDDLQPQGATAVNDNKNFSVSASRSTYQSPIITSNVLESLFESPKRSVRPLESSLITNINFKNSIDSNRLSDATSNLRTNPTYISNNGDEPAWNPQEAYARFDKLLHTIQFSPLSQPKFKNRNYYEADALKHASSVVTVPSQKSHTDNKRSMPTPYRPFQTGFFNENDSTVDQLLDELNMAEEYSNDRNSVLRDRHSQSTFVNC